MCNRYPKYVETFPADEKVETTALDQNEQENLQIKKKKKKKRAVSSLMCSNKYVSDGNNILNVLARICIKINFIGRRAKGVSQVK